MAFDIKIRMIRGKDKFCLMTNEDVTYKLNIVSASLFVKKVSVLPSAQTLLSTTAKYPIDRVCLENYPYPQGPAN